MQSGYKVIYSKTNQTVWDIALQEYQYISAVFKVLSDNQTLTIDAVIPVYTPVIIDLNYKTITEQFNENIKSLQATKKFVKSKTDQSMFDIALNQYTDINALFQLLIDNSSLAIDSVIPVNTSIMINLNFIKEQENFNETYINKVSKGREAALDNQNLWDISLQEYGSIEAVFDFMKGNNINGLDAKLNVNKHYKLPSSANVQTDVLTQYIKENRKVTTGTLPYNYELNEDSSYELREDGGKMLLEI